jgi:hypothetical protein
MKKNLATIHSRRDFPLRRLISPVQREPGKGGASAKTTLNEPGWVPADTGGAWRRLPILAFDLLNIFLEAMKLGT